MEHRDPDNLGSYTGTVYLGGWSYNHTFTSLRALTQYCVRVTAHNGVSDQDPGGAPLRAMEACVRTPGNLTTSKFNVELTLDNNKWVVYQLKYYYNSIKPGVKYSLCAKLCLKLVCAVL